jgi:hypothetical protein
MIEQRNIILKLKTLELYEVIKRHKSKNKKDFVNLTKNNVAVFVKRLCDHSIDTHKIVEFDRTSLDNIYWKLFRKNVLNRAKEVGV